MIQASNNSTSHNPSNEATSSATNVLNLIIGSFIIAVNALNILLICVFPNLRSKTNVILSSLAVVDVFSALSLITLSYVLHDQRIECLIAYSLVTALTDNSAFHLSIVTLERYVAIMHPLHYDRYFNKLCLTLCILACWGISAIVIALIVIVGFRTDDSHFIGCKTFNFPSVFIYIHVIIIVFVTIVLIVMYICIFGEIRKQHTQIQPTPGSSPRKGVITLLITVGCFMTCWWPYIICLIVGLAMRKNNNIPNLLEQIMDYSEVLVILNSGMNPIIYVIRMEPFRIAFVKLFQCQLH